MSIFCLDGPIYCIIAFSADGKIHMGSCGVDRVAKARSVEAGLNACTVECLFRRVVVGMFDNGIFDVDLAVTTANDHFCPKLVFSERNAR